MALFFGLQSLQAYAVFGWFAQLWRDHGYSAGQAGLLVGLVAGGLASRCRCGCPPRPPGATDQRGLLLAVMRCYPVGYVGLMVAPHALAILWALLVGDRRGHVPDRADADRAARAHPAGHRRAVRASPSRWAT